MDRDERWEQRDARRAARDERKAQRRANFANGHGGIIIGGVLAVIGLLLLLQNLNIFIVDDFWDYWPLIFIAVGVSRAVTSRGMGGRFWGGIVIVIGTVFLLRNLGVIHGNLWRFVWPCMFILGGLGLLVRSIDKQAGFGGWNRMGPGAVGSSLSGATMQNTLNEWAIFGGVKRRVDSQEFEGGDALAIFGGVELDLHKAGTKRTEVEIEANALFGGIEIRAPYEWRVTVRGTGIFGGYEDKTDPQTENDTRPHLFITGYAVFGGVTVKN